jgi:hypothetical protein
LQHFSHVKLMLEATKKGGLQRGKVDVDVEGIGRHLRGLTSALSGGQHTLSSSLPLLLVRDEQHVMPAFLLHGQALVRNMRAEKAMTTNPPTMTNVFNSKFCLR